MNNPNDKPTLQPEMPADFDPTIPPKCPHCKQTLLGCTVWSWRLERAFISAIYCPHCLVALHFVALPLVNEKPTMEPSRIARPS